MDEQAQKQAIVDKLTGAPPETLPPLSAFQQPWSTIYRRVRRAESLNEARLLLARAALGLDNWKRLVDELVEMLPPAGAFGGYPSLHDISGQFSEIDWLWPYWIPRGMVTLLGAAPGGGKSLVALDLARRIIHGKPFPDGTPSGDVALSTDTASSGDVSLSANTVPPAGGTDPRPGANVIFVDAEGAPALLNERAQAWGIDSRRLYLMPTPGGGSSSAGGMVDLSHPRQQRTLNLMCRRLEPALVVIDSLGAATARGEASLHAARDIMGFLASVARRQHLALLVIHHLRKNASSRRGAPSGAGRLAADDLRGSSHISAAARSVMALSVVAGTHVTPRTPPYSGGAPHPAAVQPAPGVDPADPLLLLAAPPEGGAGSRVDGPRLLEIVKTNLCRRPPPLGLLIEGDGLGVPTLRYTRYIEPAPEPTRADLCASWLFHHLDAVGGPVKPANAVVAAREAGYSRNTLYRARRLLGGLVVDLGAGPYDPNKRWALVSALPEVNITGG